MILRNSLLSILRTKGKSSLFALVIFALTLLLVLGISVWASVAQFLDDCDDFYTTIGLFEYMGTGYPNDTTYDPSMDTSLKSFDTTLINSDEAALTWESTARSFGYIDGFWRTDYFMPDQMLSVVVIGNATYDEDDNLYSTIVMKSLYSYKLEDDTIVLVDGNFGKFEQGHYYLVFGEVYYGLSPLLHLLIASYTNALLAQQGVEIPRLIDITSDESSGSSFKIPEDNILMKIARTLPVTNNSVLVMGTRNLMAQLPFQQQELHIVQGRTFTEAEYTRGDQVAVISELMAARLSVTVGDSLHLSMAASNQPGVYNSYWVDSGFSYQADFVVVGIMNTTLDKSWYAYVPYAAGIPWSRFPVGYTIGQAVLRNKEAAGFYSRVEPLLDNRYHLTIYDQGYSAVATPYQTILIIAKIVTIVCASVELAVIALFGYLYVYRQKETSETMLMLGAGRSRVVRYFLYSVSLIAVFATSAGALAGYWLHDRIIAFVARSASHYQLIDSRYSNGNLTIQRTLEFSPELKGSLFLLIGAAVFLLILLSCLAIVLVTFMRGRHNRQQKCGPKREHRSADLRGGSLKYAMLSILRGGSRSAVVPVLAITVVIFFGQLSTTVLRYQDQIEAIHNNTTIEGYYTYINGKQVGSLILSNYDIANMYHSGYINSLPVSKSEYCQFLGIPKLIDGTMQDVPPLFVPPSTFGIESMDAAFIRGPNLAATNDIRKSPDFFYADDILMTFLDGYDESILAVPYNDEQAYSCIIPYSMMEREMIQLGDTIRVALNKRIKIPEYDRSIYYQVDLRVVGSYKNQSVKETIYIPFSLAFGRPMIWEEGDLTTSMTTRTIAEGYTFSDEQKFALQSPRAILNSAGFTLKDAHDLTAFKDYLEDYGYSQVQRVSSVREFIVLKDAYFNNAIASIRQQIRYINNLYPFLYALVGIIALVVSYLLVVSRKKEFATMRGLGTSRVRTFFSFFFEQGLLCLTGTGIGLTLWSVIWKTPTDFHLLLTAGFVGLYLIGGTISVLIMNRENVLKILFDRD